MPPYDVGDGQELNLFPKQSLCPSGDVVHVHANASGVPTLALPVRFRAWLTPVWKNQAVLSNACTSGVSLRKRGRIRRIPTRLSVTRS
jgi:hypothetical protein